MLLYSLVCNIFSMTSILGLEVAWCKRLCEVSVRSATVTAGFSVLLNMTAGEGVSTVSGGRNEERELLNEEFDRETGDQA